MKIVNQYKKAPHLKSTPFFSPSFIQPKLTIGQPNDKYEQEADAMADKVMRMPQNTPAVQKKCAGCEQEEKVQSKRKGNFLSLKQSIQKMTSPEEGIFQTKPLMMKSEDSSSIATPALTFQLNSSKGGGSPLPKATNQFMSNAIGADFNNVRVHTGSDAIQMNRGLSARAFTHGKDVYFNKGEYAPSTSAGKRLLGHELTHVVQQGKISANKMPIGNPLIQRKKLYWETRRRLTWKDYIGSPNIGSSYDAATQTGYEMPSTNLTLGVEYGDKKEACTLNGKSEKKYLARVSFDPKRNNVRAFVVTHKSWVKPGRNKPNILRHEQGHFNISNVMSEKFQAKIFSWGKKNAAIEEGCGEKAASTAAIKAFEAKNFKTEILAIGKIAERVKNKADADYELETSHGTKQVKQSEWETKIANNLPNYKI